MKPKTSGTRRTLRFIKSTPNPTQLYNQITGSEGWFYKTNKQYYHARDMALIALMYLLALRVSEVLRLKKSQFSETKDRIIVSGIELSKSMRKGKPRQDLYRGENWLPLHGERAPLTDLVQDYFKISGEDLFKFGRVRAFQITISYLHIPNHWLRAFGERYLYNLWDHDGLAVSEYVKVDPRTLQNYLKGQYLKYSPV